MISKHWRENINGSQRRIGFSGLQMELSVLDRSSFGKINVITSMVWGSRRIGAIDWSHSFIGGPLR